MGPAIASTASSLEQTLIALAQRGAPLPAIAQPVLARAIDGLTRFVGSVRARVVFSAADLAEVDAIQRELEALRYDVVGAAGVDAETAAAQIAQRDEEVPAIAPIEFAPEAFAIDALPTEVGAEAFAIDALMIDVGTEAFAIDALTIEVPAEALTIDASPIELAPEMPALEALAIELASELFADDTRPIELASEAFALEALPIEPPTLDLAPPPDVAPVSIAASPAQDAAEIHVPVAIENPLAGIRDAVNAAGAGVTGAAGSNGSNGLDGAAGATGAQGGKGDTGYSPRGKPAEAVLRRFYRRGE